MSRPWNGLKIGDKVEFSGQKGIVEELYDHDSNRGEMQQCESPYDFVEIICDQCKVINHEKTFYEMTTLDLIEAFEVLLFSIDNVQPYGFDYVDNEKISELFASLSNKSRQQISRKFDIRSIKREKFDEAFCDAWNEPSRRMVMWRYVFYRLQTEQQVELLVDNEGYYKQALPLYQAENYDWNQFRCSLVDAGETMKLHLIETQWSELGTQVYGCRTNSNGSMCPCLRHANNTTAYKCFRPYLEREGKRPDGAVPRHMLDA